ncbi:MAG: DUF3810 domain-containing protein [Candidatus Cloacimonetes bacterium]|nr:DUF3810 domain-containing protein [Candidatus Cloacimonadota bacterium]
MKKVYKFWLYGILIMLVAIGFLIFSHLNPRFSQWYAINIHQNIFPHISLLISYFPFSIYEIGLLFLPILIFFFLIRDIIRLFSKTGRELFVKNIKKTPLRLLYIISILLFMFTFTSGINYTRNPYTNYIDISAQPSHLDDLIHLFHHLIDQATEIVDYVEIDGSGIFVLNRENLVDEARRIMLNLNNYYGGLGNIFPRIKTLKLFNFILDKLGIHGFFSPFTLEAHFNQNAPTHRIPFIITHELAHTVGYMREDEANFIAYLACKYSDNADFQYSGFIVAITYTLGALRKELNREQYTELYFMLPEQIIRDLVAQDSYYQRYVAQIPTVVGQRVYDGYLKLNQQDEGIRSYGKMVDLLLAYYR